MNTDLLRIVDVIHRDKEIDKEVIFIGIEAALESVARKHLGSDDDEIVILVDRETGTITATDGGEPINPVELGRIAAQAAKQIMIQKIREAERDVIFNDYEDRKGTIVSGTIQRFEGPNIVVGLGRTEGFLPRTEQMPDDNYRVGERIKAYIYDVKKVGQRVKIMLSRTHKELVRHLFQQEVPEVAEKVIEIKALAREAGYRTKIAVESNDPKVDCVGACVGVRGSRIKNIVEELNGEKIDIIRWNELTEILIANALKPAEITSIEMDPETQRATVVVDKDQLSLAIGRRGQNVRLAAKLSGWHIDIVTESEELQRAEALVENLQNVPGVDTAAALKIAEIGYASIDEILVRGAESLLDVEGMTEERATEIITFISENRQIFAAPPKVSRTGAAGAKGLDPFEAAAQKALEEQQAAEAGEEPQDDGDPLAPAKDEESADEEVTEEEPVEEEKTEEEPEPDEDEPASEEEEAEAPEAEPVDESADRKEGEEPA